MLGARAEWRLGGVTLHVPSPPPLTLHSHGPGRGPCPHSKVLAQILSMPCIQKMGPPRGLCKVKDDVGEGTGWSQVAEPGAVPSPGWDVPGRQCRWSVVYATELANAPHRDCFPPGAGLPHPAGGERPGPRAALPSPHLP